MTNQTFEVELLGSRRSEFLPKTGVVKNCKEVDGEIYYLVERKETGLIQRNWIHEDEVKIK